MTSSIFLHEPSFFKDELKFVKNCIKSGWVSTGGGYVNEFENLISKYTKSKYCVALNSGTSALDLSLKVINVTNKDEIIVPTITFIAPINAVLYNKCAPIFMDTDKNGNIDVKKTIKFLDTQTIFKKKHTYNKKTNKIIKAIIIVHVFGNLANLTPLIKICKKRNIKIIEDASESLGSYLLNTKNKKKHSGTIGDIGCFSFNANKIITTGSGGAVVTDDKNFYNRINYLSTQAKDDAIKFIHNEVGYNMKLNNISAAIGCGQIQSLEKILKRKKEIYNYYKKKINKLKNFRILTPPNHSKSNNWINLLEIVGINSDEYKNYIIRKFFEKNIQVRPVWHPNHLQKKMIKYQKFEMENFTKYCNTIICLPSGYKLKKNELDKVINIIFQLDKNEKLKNNS